MPSRFHSAIADATTTAKEYANVLAALILYDELTPVLPLTEHYMTIINDLFEDNPPEDTPFALEVFESLAANPHPQVRANVAPFIDRLLGCGFVRTEEIVWSKLLQDEATDVASQISEYLWLRLQENPRLYDAKELHLRLMDALNAGLPAPSRYTRSPATPE